MCITLPSDLDILIQIISEGWIDSWKFLSFGRKDCQICDKLQFTVFCKNWN